ncbi:MAG: hypothetical protein JWR26_2587 [Pedosphaera sp.]|nr:hypothetical protein [Pedosphaera sp.]
MTTRQFLLSGWNWNPAVVAACVLAIIGCLVIIPSLTRQRAWPLALGLMLFMVAMISPVGTLASGYLFSAHMLQHLLLLLVVPALLLAGLPAQAAKNSKCDKLTNEYKLPVMETTSAWVAGVGAMWFWHIPAFCNAAAASGGIQGLQTISLLVMGAIFWWPVIGPREAQRLTPLSGVAYLSSACMACTLLGIFITFSPVEVCSIYHHPVDRLGILPLIRQGWGLTPVVDQQVGGLLMWVPACLIYLIGIIGQLVRWYGNSQAEGVPTLTTAKAGNTASS